MPSNHSHRSMWTRAWIASSVLVAALIVSTGASAQSDLDYWQILAMDKAAFRIFPMALLPVTEEPGQILIYGDRYGYARAVQMTGSDAIEIWRSRILDGIPRQIFVEDLNGDGRVEIIVLTQNGRIYIFDEQFNERWKNLREDYNVILAMTIANMDDDPAYELVFIGDQQLIYVDGQEFLREFASNQTYIATDLAVGNVDSDPALEVVLNTGTVIDAVRGEPDWLAEPFGTIIELLDIDGDGIQEIIGYSIGEALRIFDADEQQEKPAS